MVQFPLKNGTKVCSPDIAGVDIVIVEYWKRRANTVKHTVMRARYSDLVWDLGKSATMQRPEVEFARIAIDSYLEGVQHDLCSREIEAIRWLDRALDLSRSINDTERTNLVVQQFFSFYDDVAVPQYPGH